MTQYQSVSVVIPTYNRAHLLGSCIENILAQTYPVREIIVVDDGSTDETAQVIRSCASKDSCSEGRIKYIRQTNQGQSVAFNNSISMATGDWIAFQNSDDLWLPQKLERQFRALEKYKDQCELCFTDAWFMNNPYMKSVTIFGLANKNFPGEMGIVEDPTRLLLHHQPCWVQTIMARTDLVRQAGGFDPKLRYCEDFDFVFRMSLKTKFCYVSPPMALIDRTPSAIRHEGLSKEWEKEEFKLQMEGRRLETQLNLCETLAPDIRKAARENMRSHYSKWTSWYLKIGEFEKAQEAVSAAAKHDLTPGVAFKWALSHLTPKLGRKITQLRDERVVRREHGMGGNW